LGLAPPSAGVLPAGAPGSWGTAGLAAAGFCGGVPAGFWPGVPPPGVAPGLAGGLGVAPPAGVWPAGLAGCCGWPCAGWPGCGFFGGIGSFGVAIGKTCC